MLIFSILLAACVCLLRIASWTRTFPRAEYLHHSAGQRCPNGVPILWQRLFWFFVQAEVYVAMLPCFGSSRIWFPRFPASRFGKSASWFWRCAVWASSVFASGPAHVLQRHEPVFAAGLFASGFFSRTARHNPSGQLARHTLERAHPSQHAMLFALGFISLFLSGGLSGIFLARQDLAAAAVSDDFITGHFHLVMGVAATFSILGALFFLVPQTFWPPPERAAWQTPLLDYFRRRLLCLHAHALLGLIAHSRISPGTPLAPSPSPVLRFAPSSPSPFSSLFSRRTVPHQFPWSLFRGKKGEECNLWRATTLEWSVPSPPPADDFGPSDPVCIVGLTNSACRTWPKISCRSTLRRSKVPRPVNPDNRV